MSNFILIRRRIIALQHNKKTKEYSSASLPEIHRHIHQLR